MGKVSFGRVMEIDLFRFVFSVIITYHHAEFLFGENMLFPGGAFGVEFFFLVSGYLMMASLEKIRGETKNLGLKTVSFLKRKAAAIYPEFVLSFIIAFIIQCVAKNLPLGKIELLFANSIFELLLVQRVGIGANSVSDVIWYVQSMLLCMAILYPLIRKYPEMMRRIVMPLTALILLGYLQANYKHFRDPNKWLGWTYKGNIRAMAELCLGAECYYVARWLKGLQLTNPAKVLLTTLKWVIWIRLFFYMWTTTWNKDAFMLGCLCVTVILAFSGQCLDVPLYQNKLVTFLGKYSLPLYLCHKFYAKYLPYLLPEGMRYRYLLLCYTACSFGTALLVMFLAGKIRKSLPHVKATLGRYLLSQT